MRAIAPNVGKYLIKQIAKTPLTKTVWYPVLKKITSVAASKTITKKGLSAFAAKAVPVIGGAASAAINIATMIPMANRLKSELRKYHLPEKEIVEVEEEDKATFADKASDALSSVAAGAVKAARGAKDAGKGMVSFAKQVGEKTKAKIEGKG
ncbi:MAG: hypothetical protein LBI44_02485 [Oscillospiraceae bacterium]|nr:hypothetical protein [Oscillospiraceae bacterium]